MVWDSTVHLTTRLLFFVVILVIHHKGGFTEERRNGFVLIRSSTANEENCKTFLNPTVNLPAAVRTNEIRNINLPNKAFNFGSIQPIPFQESRDEYHGEAIYLKNDISANGRCSSIPNNGIYSNVIGTFQNGDQAWFAGHIITDENTFENPIADGGATMISVSPGDEGDNPFCPVPAKSFVNSKLVSYYKSFKKCPA